MSNLDFRSTFGEFEASEMAKIFNFTFLRSKNYNLVNFEKQKIQTFCEFEASKLEKLYVYVCKEQNFQFWPIFKRQKIQLFVNLRLQKWQESSLLRF